MLETVQDLIDIDKVFPDKVPYTRVVGQCFMNTMEEFIVSLGLELEHIINKQRCSVNLILQYE